MRSAHVTGQGPASFEEEFPQACWLLDQLLRAQSVLFDATSWPLSESLAWAPSVPTGSPRCAVPGKPN